MQSRKQYVVLLLGALISVIFCVIWRHRQSPSLEGQRAVELVDIESSSTTTKETAPLIVDRLQLDKDDPLV